jgi:purine-nucleoside/S-methyl-5'-thioadenosine phosphorylase / adenosine deaminase
MMAMTDPQPNGAFQWIQEPWGRALQCTGLPARHLFTSSDVTLREDQSEWSAVAGSLGVPRERLLLIRQVHGVEAAIVRRGWTPPWQRPQADVIVTDDPSVAIGVRVADCAPVLLFDRRTGAAGAAHAGWRGTAARAAPAALEAMRRTFATSAADVIAAVGPCLGACCGEVGPDVIDAFRAAGAAAAAIDAWFSPGRGDRLQLDLERANRDQLEQAGLDPAAIFASGLCTKTHHERLHSYRVSRDAAGRSVGAIRAAD